MKVCTSCGDPKPLSEFNKKGKTRVQGKCRDCQKLWYKSYYDSSPKEKSRLTTRNKETVAQNRRKLRELKESTPCADCGNKFPYYVMDFDHLGNKKFNVSAMITHNWEQIKEEISKCELVCANCHRVRTHTRK